MSSPRVKVNCHNVRLIVIVALTVMLCYPALIHTAAVRSEKQLQRVLLRDSRSVRIPRTTETSMEEDERDDTSQICNATQACGWSVYDRFTRDILYNMRNTCRCSDDGYKCVRYNELLSSSAYMYRCKQNTTAEDIEYPYNDSI
ncbi:PREDICTED: uncharacterized protein LOC105569081 [Vollenhovia emeryi]|uniref:uncharacterized protein LOC105569081 n=1 Tax=Vollenhovia emeryi TaxID=411798 RepID=UPI0005F50488|nr:PREDICTED: uncharacterized protein LOC105569081 [Vollenhovia emeryi]